MKQNIMQKTIQSFLITSLLHQFRPDVLPVEKQERWPDRKRHARGKLVMGSEGTEVDAVPAFVVTGPRTGVDHVIRTLRTAHSSGRKSQCSSLVLPSQSFGQFRPDIRPVIRTQVAARHRAFRRAFDGDAILHRHREFPVLPVRQVRFCCTYRICNRLLFSVRRIC